MRIIWEHPDSNLGQLLTYYKKPLPASTTVATWLKRMKDKGFIDFKTVNGVRHYFAISKKENHIKGRFDRLLEHYFNNSNTRFASFFTENSNWTESELLELRQLIDDKLNENKE